jgi:bifunctional NMN adenylyltransferase/nudix hydrolase
MKTKPKPDYGIIVGRFQTHTLHKGHIDLIESVRSTCNRTIIILGLSDLRTTKRNPLDYQSRKVMLETHFPDISVLYHSDQPSDDTWSQSLDEIIQKHTTPSATVMLFGARDSFLKHYKGRYPTQELESETIYSATEERRLIGLQIPKNEHFRAGVIWATQNQYPTAYTTVDIAIFNEKEDCILLGRKSKETKFRFIGGFSSPETETFEADARREVKEETGIEITDPIYVGSAKIPDWRYRSEESAIKTLLFKAKYQFGKAEASDDIAEIKWFRFDELTEDDIVVEHHALFNMIKKFQLQ